MTWTLMFGRSLVSLTLPNGYYLKMIDPPKLMGCNSERQNRRKRKEKKKKKGESTESQMLHIVTPPKTTMTLEKHAF